MNEEQHLSFDEADHPVAPEAPPIGATLRARREARGESPQEVAAALKFSARQVLAMEEERLHELPGPAFVKGFYRNYGRHLGVDIEPMIAARWPDTSVRNVELVPVTNARGTMPGAGRGAGVGRAFGALVTVLLLVLALGWYFDGFRLDDAPADGSEAALADSSADEDAPLPDVEIVDDEPAPAPEAVREDAAASVPANAPEALVTDAAPAIIEAPREPLSAQADRASPSAEPVQDARASETEAPAQGAPAVGSEPDTPVTGEPAPEQISSAPEAAAPAAPVAAAPRAQPPVEAGAPAAQAAAGGSSRLEFRLSADAWLQVKDAQDRTLYAGTSRAGTTRVVQGDPPFWVTVGNATAVSLEFDGEPVELAPHMHTAGVARLVLE